MKKANTAIVRFNISEIQTGLTVIGASSAKRPSMRARENPICGNEWPRPPMCNTPEQRKTGQALKPFRRA